MKLPISPVSLGICSSMTVEKKNDGEGGFFFLEFFSLERWLVRVLVHTEKHRRRLDKKREDSMRVP